MKTLKLTITMLTIIFIVSCSGSISINDPINELNENETNEVELILSEYVKDSESFLYVEVIRLRNREFLISYNSYGLDMIEITESK